MFYCPSLFAGTGAATLLRRFQQTDADLVAVSPDVMQALAQRNGLQGIIATFALFATPLSALEPGAGHCVAGGVLMYGWLQANLAMR